VKTFALLSAAALIGFGSAASTGAQARDRGNGGAIAAGVIGGLAAGALIGAAASNAYAAPAHVYYGSASAPYRTTRVVHSYHYAPEVYEEVYGPPRAYRTTRVVRTYDSYAPVGYWGGPSVSVGFGFGTRAW